MLAKVHCCAIVGLDAILVEVEVDIASQGLPSFTIVGLPDKAVEEAKERVRSAIRNSGADFPAKKITVNLAPADLPKEGPSYDLPIALGILIASGQLSVDLSNSLCMGELALDGTVRLTNGVLSLALLAQKKKIEQLYIPSPNVNEASIIQDLTIFPIDNLQSLFLHLTNQKKIDPAKPTSLNSYLHSPVYDLDMTDIKGQEQAKRALEIAAAGSHNILMTGSPGAGKTLLARTLPSILPNLTFSEAIEVTRIYSTAGLLGNKGVITVRPFRSPHHTTSHVGLIGGGSFPKPGEISLAHRGVLFMDEFPEFPRTVLESLRQPIEDGFVTISRANGRIVFPSKCMIVAAQNPCPCGYLNDPYKECSCLPGQILRYQKRISGPLLDRIDIHLSVPSVKVEKLTSQNPSDAEKSKDIKKRVQNARDMQTTRFKNTSLSSNSEMTTKEVKEFCQLSSECHSILRMAVTNMHLSARAYHRIVKLARTIADLELSKDIQTTHIAEALQYRSQQDRLHS